RCHVISAQLHRYPNNTRNTKILFNFYMITATTDTSPLSLHDALPIFASYQTFLDRYPDSDLTPTARKLIERLRNRPVVTPVAARSEEHTSELQSHLNLVCRLLLEKKNNTREKNIPDKWDVDKGTNIKW